MDNAKVQQPPDSLTTYINGIGLFCSEAAYQAKKNLYFAWDYFNDQLDNQPLTPERKQFFIASGLRRIEEKIVSIWEEFKQLTSLGKTVIGPIWEDIKVQLYQKMPGMVDFSNIDQGTQRIWAFSLMARTFTCLRGEYRENLLNIIPAGISICGLAMAESYPWHQPNQVERLKLAYSNLVANFILSGVFELHYSNAVLTAANAYFGVLADGWPNQVN